MSDITISENGEYFYIMQGDSDADCWPQYKEAASTDEEMIIRLCKKVIDLQEQFEQKDKEIEQLEDLMVSNSRFIDELKARSEKLERLGVLATKHCPSDHYDFEEIKAIYIELNEVDENE